MNGTPSHASDAPLPAPAQLTTSTNRVIVALNMGMDARSDGTALDASMMASIDRTQQALLDSLAGASVSNITHFEYVPFTALTVDDNGLSMLQASPYVAHIEPDRVSVPMLNSSAHTIGAAGTNGAWSYGYSGSGQVVAVLDSGIDKYHPYLAGQVIAEACFSTNGLVYDKNNNPSSAVSLCPGQVSNSTVSGSGLNCPANIANCDHGTLISGTISSTHPTYRGIAPGAKVISVQVFTRIEGSVCPVDWGFFSPCVLSFTSDQIRALEHIYKLRDTYNIGAVTLSLGADFWSSEAQCDADNFARKAIIDLLRGAGIATFSPTGNAGLSNKMIAPACISSVIAVSATDDADNVASFSDTTTFMDFFAPGDNIHSLVPGGGFQDKSGTSMSTPITVGAWLLLKQANPYLTVDALYSVLAATGKPIAHDGVFSPRVNVRAALERVTVLPLSPIKNATVTTVPVSFTWNTLEGTLHYKLTLKNRRTGEISSFYVMPESCDATLCTYTHSTDLVNHDRYKWQVRAYMSSGFTFKSRNSRFTVAYPDIPQLFQPINTAALTSANELNTFEWSNLHGVSKYKLIVRDVTAGVILIRTTVFPPCGATCVYNLPQSARDTLVDGHTYKWKVKAYYFDEVNRSENRFFTTTFSP